MTTFQASPPTAKPNAAQDRETIRKIEAELKKVPFGEQGRLILRYFTWTGYEMVLRPGVAAEFAQHAEVRVAAPAELVLAGPASLCWGKQAAWSPADPLEQPVPGQGLGNTEPFGQYFQLYETKRSAAKITYDINNLNEYWYAYFPADIAKDYYTNVDLSNVTSVTFENEDMEFTMSFKSNGNLCLI